MHDHPSWRRGGEREDERGAGLIEYALLLAMIAVVCFGAVSFFGEQSQGGFGKSKECLEAAHNGAEPPARCR